VELRIRSDDVLSISAAAKELGKHRMTLYRWAKNNIIATVELGGVLFIPRSEVDRLKKEQEENKKAVEVDASTA
jgi:excisionase family DNA binding protein